MTKSEIMAKVIDNEIKNYSFIVEESIKAEQEFAKVQGEYFVVAKLEKDNEVIARVEEDYANTTLKEEEERIRANGGKVEYRYKVICYQGTEKVFEDYGTYDTQWEAEHYAEMIMKYECRQATSYVIRKVAVEFFDFEKQFADTLAQVQRDWAKMDEQQKGEAWGLISDLYKDLNGVRPHGMAQVWGLM